MSFPATSTHPHHLQHLHYPKNFLIEPSWKKSRIRETLKLSTDADSSTNTIKKRNFFGGNPIKTKLGGQRKIIFLVGAKNPRGPRIFGLGTP